MKKNLIFWALALMMAGAVCSCSKSDSDDDGNNAGIEKTYADDDFVLTDRNIKEKMVGNWEITYLQKYDNGWVEYSAADLGALKNVTMRADGTGEMFGLEDVHWTVADGVVTINSLYLVFRAPDGSSSVSFLLGNTDGYGMKRSDAEALGNALAPGANVSTELMETYKVKVRKMEKDFFNMYQIDEKWNAEIRLKRR